MRTCFQACQRHLATTILLLPLIIAGCTSVPLDEPAPDQARVAANKSKHPNLPPAGSGRGGYYKDDGPGDNPPDDLLNTPDAEPRVEPLSPRGNRPYVVFGKSYTPFTDDRPFKQRGIGSWYGKKFHGQKTSSGEIYDMYKMTAAHPTLPIPSYVRVTHVGSGRQVIVRVNDRGPFHASRIIDLSYTAALKLGYVTQGSSELEIERLLPDDIARINAERAQQAASGQAAQQVPQVELMPVALPRATEGIETRPLPPAEILPATAQTAEMAPAGGMMPVSFATSAEPAAPAGGGYYLQIGAYTRQVNAEAERDRLQQGAASGLPAIEVFESNGIYRLHSGPFATREAATAAASGFQSAGRGKPVVVQR